MKKQNRRNVCLVSMYSKKTRIHVLDEIEYYFGNEQNISIKFNLLKFKTSQIVKNAIQKSLMIDNKIK